jgi:hypothetical protein
MTIRTRRRGRERPPDREPELTHYEDDGCAMWHACLSCPLPRCIYDDPRGPRAGMRHERDVTMTRLSREGWSVDAIAAAFGVSRRHVFRILQQQRQGALSGGP